MNRTAWPLFAICALCIIGIIWLTATHNPVPDILTTIALASLTGAAGITIPTTNPASAAAARTLFGRKITPPPAPVPPGAPVAATEAAVTPPEPMPGAEPAAGG